MITVDDQREPQGEELTRSEGGMRLAWLCKKRGRQPVGVGKELTAQNLEELVKDTRRV